MVSNPCLWRCATMVMLEAAPRWEVRSCLCLPKLSLHIIHHTMSRRRDWAFMNIVEFFELSRYTSAYVLNIFVEVITPSSSSNQVLLCFPRRSSAQALRQCTVLISWREHRERHHDFQPEANSFGLAVPTASLISVKTFINALRMLASALVHLDLQSDARMARCRSLTG